MSLSLENKKFLCHSSRRFRSSLPLSDPSVRCTFSSLSILFFTFPLRKVSSKCCFCSAQILFTICAPIGSRRNFLYGAERRESFCLAWALWLRSLFCTHRVGRWMYFLSDSVLTFNMFSNAIFQKARCFIGIAFCGCQWKREN